jgi:hypothetical protein
MQIPDYRPFLKNLRALSNETAADRIIHRYSLEAEDWYMVQFLIPHISWNKSNRMRLARYYLSHIPFADGRMFTLFLRIMPLREFLQALQPYLESQKEDRHAMELTRYYLKRVLAQINPDTLCEKDRKQRDEFLAREATVFGCSSASARDPKNA